jgi:hypothetical protein
MFATVQRTSDLSADRDDVEVLIGLTHKLIPFYPFLEEKNK